MAGEIATETGSRLWRKTHFRTLWSSDLPLELKFSLSRDLFRGREAFIFAGGPSLLRVDLDRLRDRLRNALVICIKQTVDVVGPESDLMVMNFCNFSAYDWGSIGCPVIWATFDPSHPDLIRSKNATCNATFEVVENGPNTEEGFRISTAGRRHWENFGRFTDGKVRWGPGLMYELAMPVAVHAGVSHIHLVGWDIGTLSKETQKGFMNEHFYKNDKVEMKTGITNLEITTVADSTRDLRLWLEGRGIGLSVISDRSLVDASVPREPEWLKA